MKILCKKVELRLKQLPYVTCYFCEINKRMKVKQNKYKFFFTGRIKKRKKTKKIDIERNVMLN